MIQLAFPSYNFRFKNSENKVHIFDVIRKKFVVLQPEEWVRQHIVHYLIHDKKYPASHINVEKELKINTRSKRYDVVVFNANGAIRILVECKAPEIQINQTTFDQIARYNMSLKAEYLMISNGLRHYCCQMDHENEKYIFLNQIPEFNR
ncbi:MAG: type I restriction enzyme HsdR N-terminal domain-containing protein [Flavobacteriaceae bacterium]